MDSIKEYVFSYQSMLTTDAPVCRHYLLLRCMPQDNDFQRVKKLDLVHAGFDFLSRDTDSFGTVVLYGGSFSSHRSLLWQSVGVVAQRPYALKNDADPFIYTLPSALTAPDVALTAQVKDLMGLPNTLGKALRLNSLVHVLMHYQRGVTAVTTAAAQAFAHRAGVCQDFSHVLIALCRLCGLPARYVNGLILGDGETHAWTEILIDGIWYGFDPTHDKKIEYGYIKLAHGRDALDCQVCRGVFSGQSGQRTAVHVLVGEA